MLGKAVTLAVALQYASPTYGFAICTYGCYDTNCDIEAAGWGDWYESDYCSSYCPGCGYTYDTPPAQECSAGCQQAFFTCTSRWGKLKGALQGTASKELCREELDAGDSRLMEGGCVPGCISTPGMTFAGTSMACPDACEDEFTLCVNNGPGYSTCMSQLRSGNHERLSTVCDPACKLSDAAVSLATVSTCSDECNGEFGTCVALGPGYAMCEEEIRDKVGPLGLKCEPSCVLSPANIALAAAGGACSSECEAEFPVCVVDGPGFSTCVRDLRDGVGILSDVCAPDCVLTEPMTKLV